VGVAALVTAVLYWWFHRTLFGVAMRSCADNRLGAHFVGINVRLMVSLSFAMSASLGALAGIVAAPLTFVSFDGGLILGIKGFVAAILGGSGSYLGAILGGLALGVLESVSAGYISSTYKDSIAFALLILILTLRPAGLVSSRVTH
jgi:branched-chain amino acid transport system permease protein